LESQAGGGGLIIKRKTFDSALAFVIEHFQYRYVSAHNYLHAYDRGQRKVDLLIGDMVDYDYWLKDGASPPTTLEKQIEVMEKISVLTGGRVHAFVPFCPYRQAAHDQNRAGGKSPLELVQDAILNRGAIGVKLYPPMGFAPFGNAQIQAQDRDFWRRRDWLHGLAQSADFGSRLDAALKKLYDWCSDPSNDVPIMAHSNLSNGPADDFQALNAWEHWRTALGAAGSNRLRICFGHFGNPSGNEQGDGQARGLLSLLGTGAMPGGKAFVDASYFTDVLDHRERLIKEMVTLLQLDASGKNVLPKRAMYGTDWKMMLIEHGVAGYLNDFDEIIGKVAETAAKQGIALPDFKGDFFGANAVRFLGLKSGPARTRLDAFYQRNLGSLRPTWMKKVDSPPA
jgi:hypothetical protein